MPHLHWLDVLVLVLYVVGIAALTLKATKRNQTADDYFVAGRSMPAEVAKTAPRAASQSCSGERRKSRAVVNSPPGAAAPHIQAGSSGMRMRR